MKITKVSKDWYILKSEGDDCTLTMFGYSRGHVKQKFDSYVRDLGLEGVRRKPKIRQHMENCSFKEAVPWQTNWPSTCPENWTGVISINNRHSESN